MKVSRLFLGNSNAYIVVNGNESAIIDCGLGDKSDRIMAEMARLGALPSGLKFIAITHAHYDHVGSLRKLKSIFPHAQTVIQKQEAANLENGRSPLPAGTMWFSRPISFVACQIFHHCIRFAGTKADVVFDQHFVASLGNEEIEFFHTPGHTAGSMCLRVGRRAVFVGDSVFHLLPGCLYPPFADSPLLLANSWEKIVATGCPVAYPGHGRPVPMKLLKSHQQQITTAK